MAKEDVYFYCETNPDYAPGWHWITDQIALGSYPLEPEFSDLLDSGVTAILSIRAEEPAYDRARFAESHVVLTEDFLAFPYEKLVAALRFIHRVVRGGHKVYVHCFAGKSRSAFVVACYLMLTEDIPFAEAVRRVTSIRTQCYPQPGLYRDGLLDRLLANRDRILSVAPLEVA